MATYPPQQGYPSQQGYPHQQSSTVVVHQQPATTHTLVVQERSLPTRQSMPMLWFHIRMLTVGLSV